MSTVVEYHQCKMGIIIAGTVTTPGTWGCLHVNLDGSKCTNTYTGHLVLGSLAGSHVTTSEAITARFEHQAKASGNAKRPG